MVKVSNAVDNIKKDVLTLGEEVKKILDWGLALDYEVSAGMWQVESWKNRFEKLQERTGEVKEISDLYNLDENYYVRYGLLSVPPTLTRGEVPHQVAPLQRWLSLMLTRTTQVKEARRLKPQTLWI